MKVTLDDFEIAGGYDRTLSVLSSDDVSMQQQTQTALLSRAEWLSAWPERASRSIPLIYTVVHPPCDTLEDALMQSRLVLTQCPKGGVLIEEHESIRITYAQAWVTSIRNERLGVSNRFHYSLLAVSPDITTLSPLAQMDARYPNVIAITGLTGGAAGDLDNLITTDVAVGRYVDFDIGLMPHRWKLTTWTDETEDAEDGRVLPDDFDAGTNPKIWRRLI